MSPGWTESPVLSMEQSPCQPASGTQILEMTQCQGRRTTAHGCPRTEVQSLADSGDHASRMPRSGAAGTPLAGEQIYQVALHVEHVRIVCVELAQRRGELQQIVPVWSARAG